MFTVFPQRNLFECSKLLVRLRLYKKSNIKSQLSSMITLLWYWLNSKLQESVEIPEGNTSITL